MKLRTIGAVLAGAAMIGATVAGAAAAATVPGKAWFIDPATGTPNVTIVVGAQANASDVVSASLIAAAVGNMATVEQTASVPTTASATWDKIGDYNYTYVPTTTTYNATCADRPATWYTDYGLLSTRYWETSEDDYPSENAAAGGYRTYVQIATPSEIRHGTGGAQVTKGLSTLWFSNSAKDWDANDRIYKLAPQSGAGTGSYWLVNNAVTGSPTALITRTLPNYAGGSYDDGDGQWDLDYAFYTTLAWVNVTDPAPRPAAPTVGQYSKTVDCDYDFGGTGTGMEAHEEIQFILTSDDCAGCAATGLPLFKGDKGVVSGIVYRTTEIRYPLLENGQNICGIQKCWGMVDFETARTGRFTPIKFLGKMYQPMFAGATWYETPGYLGAYFMYGKPYAEKEKIMKVGDVYNYHGWTVTLNDVNIYENKAYITVAGPTLTAPFNFIMVMDSLGDCGPCCPDCAIYGGKGAFTSNPTRRNEYDPYVNYTTVTKTKDDYAYNFFRYVNFMLDGIKTFVGADGTYLAEFNLYAIEDFGYLEDKGCCDPFVTTPNDYGLAITGGWRKVTTVMEETTPLKKAATVVGPWELNGTSATDPFEYIQWMPAPVCNAYCPDANFDTLELRLCDTIKVPDCETSYTVNGPENYFKIELLDVDFGTYNTDLTMFDEYLTREVYVGKYTKAAPNDKDGLRARLSMTTAGQTIKYTANVKIDPVELIKLDIEVNTATNKKNLVLVGGPVYNSIVKDLVDMGASTVDWATSRGEWEWIADPMAKGYDVLIVAGANREETRMAAEDLVRMLN
ncbi:MAG: S-layer protein precursor [Candidatus Methanofastidiosum methylothiophilum]|uniref:S-layer protein n=1 Tax=Candidatus Methanofastidiosum methylothiophilum TaxID=1705564 RepID=A0A150IV63_9EURY|nr:MAG: S-layer protein precursor [Candidatus Methanofastidiosum methylthiophilus]KYC48755.1 MAG: S-layer protein precursor [Candidatus Methanofastidiosum methylthiophilus]KYC51403.1 MAG: S-layer protein precursor [Candidatus Methanofastidiosum methylthiophilus]